METPPHSRLTLAFAVIGGVVFVALVVIALADVDWRWLEDLTPKGMQGKSPH